ncbi:MAG: NUDIX hydrolase [Myxococcota bacterium]
MPDFPLLTHLDGLLREYAPRSEPEQSDHAQMRSLLCDESTDWGSRATFAPGHFTASAFLLSPERDALFLIHHRKLDRWLQPGGHLEPGDVDVLEAARREILEEVGLPDAPLHPLVRGLFDVDIHHIPARSDEPEHQHLDVRFLFLVPSRELVAATSEVKAGRWVPLTECASTAGDESVMRAAQKVISLEGSGAL